MRQELLREIKIYTSRSSGPGGQHVNKTESKVELHWDLEASSVFSEDKKIQLKKRLKHRLTGDGVFIIYSQKTRSQIKNREIVSEAFLDIIEKALLPPKKRIATNPSRSSVEKRLKQKKANAEKKKRRKLNDES